MKDSSWQYSKIHRCRCKIIEEETLWGQVTCNIWLPDKNEVVQVPKESLVPIESASINDPSKRKAELIYSVAAGRVADAISISGRKKIDENVLLAPLESAVTPLPHQLDVLQRTVKRNPVRFLLADEVGLGKTIEAGLIIQELKLRGLIKRVLIVVPTGLINQWISEMRVHFNEKFHLFVPKELAAFSKYFEATKEQLELEEEPGTEGFNPWMMGENVICPMDSIKPMKKRKGWNQKELERYNTERFLNVINAGWDLVVIDEAHRVAGADPSVARFKLGIGLGLSTPHILLLSATPHQGKSDAFHRLLSILDEEAFPDIESVNVNAIKPYLIRNEKRKVKDASGKLLFKPRCTNTITVTWNGKKHQLQKQLYNDVTEYIRTGYNLMKRLSGVKKTAVGFLLVLIQRLVTSSTKAVAATLERRLEVLKNGKAEFIPTISEEEWEDMDGDQQNEQIIDTTSFSHEIEIKQVQSLLDSAKQVIAQETDVKTEKLLSLIYELQAKENDVNLKILIFTEFTATQKMLEIFLTNRGFSTTLINGSMSLDERTVSMRNFADDVRIMISTEAGGEGLNLQCCHVVINYDLPWNPMRIEQRIGRVDRIGQKHKVLAVNMLIGGTVEARVREVLEIKLRVICSELGIDKIGDILDSAEIGKVFEEIYSGAIRGNDVSSIDESLEKLREKLSEIKEFEELYLPVTTPSENNTVDYNHHPFPYWVEQMAVNYALSNDGKAEKHLYGWDIIWPDNERNESVVFSVGELEKYPNSIFLSVGDIKLKNLLDYQKFKRISEVSLLKCSSLPNSVVGTWSLWTIRLKNNFYDMFRVMPLFVHDNGKIFSATAHAVWDALIAEDFTITNTEPSGSKEKLRVIAEQTFERIYSEMLGDFKSMLSQEKVKKERLFNSKFKAINKVGIDNIRTARLKVLNKEQNEWEKQLTFSHSVIPELRPVIILKVQGAKKSLKTSVSMESAE